MAFWKIVKPPIPPRVEFAPNGTKYLRTPEQLRKNSRAYVEDCERLSVAHFLTYPAGILLGCQSVHGFHLLSDVKASVYQTLYEYGWLRATRDRKTRLPVAKVPIAIVSTASSCGLLYFGHFFIGSHTYVVSTEFLDKTISNMVSWTALMHRTHVPIGVTLPIDVETDYPTVDLTQYFDVDSSDET